MRYLKPLRPFFAWSQLSIPTVYDDSLSYYEILNKCIFHFNEMLKIMQENYEIIDEAFAKILEECKAAIARCEEAAARAEAAQSAAEKAQAAAEAAQAAAEAAQKLAEAAQAAAEAARDDAVIAQKAAETAQAAAEAAQAAAEAAQQKAETAQAAAEAAQAKAEDAQEKAESARDAAQAAQTASETAQQKAEAAQTKAENARDAAQAAQTAAESARDAAQTAAESARDAAQAAQAAAEEIKKALDNYYNKTESDATFVKKAGDTMTGNLVMNTNNNPNNGTVYLAGAATRFRTIYLTGNQDFNNLLLNGIYCRAGMPKGDKNYPSTLDGKNFILIVIAGTSSKIVKQIFFSYETTQDIYIRFSSLIQDEIQFGNWEKIATDEQINNSLSGYLPLTGGTMTGKINVEDEWTDTFTGLSKGNYVTTINENSDLNNVKTNSINFYKSTIAMSEESKNFPAKVSGFLVSLSQYSSTYTRQIYYTTIYKDIYTRFYNSSNSSWSNWEKISFETDIVGNYLPLSGGTMTGNITMSDDTKLIGNAETSDFFKLIQIPNGSDMNKITESGFYAITGGYNVSNVPEGISGGTNSFSCFVFPWWYPNTTGISQLAFGGQGSTVKGVYFRLTNNPEVGWSDWVRLDNITEEPKNGTPIFYKRVYSTDNRFFIDIYRITGNDNIAKIDIYDTSPGGSTSLNIKAENYPTIFSKSYTSSKFNKSDIPFKLINMTNIDLDNSITGGIKELTYEKLFYSRGYSFTFDAEASYIIPYVWGITFANINYSRAKSPGRTTLIISVINDVESEWSWS